jgi:hypothetical protein
MRAGLVTKPEDLSWPSTYFGNKRIGLVPDYTGILVVVQWGEFIEMMAHGKKCAPRSGAKINNYSVVSTSELNQDCKWS